MFTKLLDQQLAKNPRSSDEGFSLTTKYVYGSRYVNTTAARIDLAAIATKFWTDDDLVNRTRYVERRVEGNG
jgi:amino acid permease